MINGGGAQIFIFGFGALSSSFMHCANVFKNLRLEWMELIEGIFYIRRAKDFIYHSFASLCCAFLEVAPILYGQGATFNMPNSYLHVRSTSVPSW